MRKIGIRKLGIGRMRRVLGAAVVAGSAATTVPTTPTVHYHFASQTPTVDGSDRLLSCPDLRGLAALSGVSFAGPTVGPTVRTDGLGRKFCRFNGPDYMLVANALTGVSGRAVTVLAVIRHHRANATLNVFSPRYAAYTDDTTNTTYSLGSTLRSVVTTNSAPLLYGAGVSSASAWHKTGCQLQVVAVGSRTTANGAQRLYLNERVAAVAQSGVTHAACIGGVIGGIPATSNAVTASNNFMDLYELVVIKGELSNAQIDAAVAAMQANWDIPPIANELMIEGDSINQGTGAVTSGLNMAMQLTEPGSAIAMPRNWRVTNQAASGNKVADIAARRDATNGGASLPVPGGRNIVLPQIGRNDLPVPTAAGVIGLEIEMLHNTMGMGFLQRGWEVLQGVNICVGPGLDTENNNLRAIFRNAMFKTNTLTGPGQTYDGKLALADLPLWTVAGDTIFDTPTDAADTTWMAGDSTHPNLPGAIEMAKACRAALTAFGVT